MDPIITEILKGGVFAAAAIYFFIRYDGEVKDRRATEKAAVEMILAIKDRQHAETIASHNATTEVLATNARMIESQAAAAQTLVAEVRALASEIRHRPAEGAR